MRQLQLYLDRKTYVQMISLVALQSYGFLFTFRLWLCCSLEREAKQNVANLVL